MSNKNHKRAASARLTPENVGAGDFGRLRRQTRHESQGHAKDKMNAIACCYSIACALDRDKVQREILMADPFFKKLKHKPKKEDLSQWVLLYNFRAKKKGPARDRARRYGAILRRYKHEGVAPRGALARLEEEGGVTQAYNKCPKRCHADGRNDTGHEELSQSALDQEHSQDDSDHSQDESSPSKQREPSRPVCDERSYLRVYCSEEQMLAVLALSKVRLTVEIMPDPKPSDSGWKLVRLLALKDQPS